VLAFLSVRLQCNIDALRLLHHELPARETDHILEFDDREFQVQFHACFPGYVALTESYLDVKDAGILPTHNGCIRFVARHPAKKILNAYPCLPQLPKSLGVCFRTCVGQLPGLSILMECLCLLMTQRMLAVVLTLNGIASNHLFQPELMLLFSLCRSILPNPRSNIIRAPRDGSNHH